MQGLLNGSPILLREENRIAALAVDLHRLVGLANLVDQGVKALAGLCGRHSCHHDTACVRKSVHHHQRPHRPPPAPPHHQPRARQRPPGRLPALCRRAGWPGVLLAGKGSYRDAEGTLKTAGIFIGPEFDPSPGEVRSDEPDNIACWFIDSDCNGESFFVRQAYFLGQNDPYKSLKTSLKAEIDPEAWESLNSDVSVPFSKPSTGRIAVKVINHLGDEVMKVYRV
jgi:hypothetical protein